MSIIAHWFKKRRSTALGFVAFASSIGGMVFSVAFRNLYHTVGFKWSMRIIAFVLMVALGIANLVRDGIAYTCLSMGIDKLPDD